jgi:hypothetical protein
VIELVVPESPLAQGSPAEEEQQLENHGIENKADEEEPPPGDTEDEKMYQDADKVESFGAKAPVPAVGFGLCWNTWASPQPLGTGSRKSRVQGRWSLKPS